MTHAVPLLDLAHAKWLGQLDIAAPSGVQAHAWISSWHPTGELVPVVDGFAAEWEHIV